MRLFGLISTVDVISEIRDSRLGDDYARAVAGSYAEPESVRSELEEARALMKRLGCFVVRTDGKAIEESAAEIISHLEEIQEARARPRPPVAPNISSILIKRFSKNIASDLLFYCIGIFIR